MCKLAAISVRFGREHEHIRNLMQLGGDFWEITANQSKCRTRIAQEIAASLHLKKKIVYLTPGLVVNFFKVLYFLGG